MGSSFPSSPSYTEAVPAFLVTPTRHTGDMVMKTCRHRPVDVAGLQMVACDECATIEWSGATGPLDPAEGMAALFGDFRLVGRLPAVRAPGREVLMYRAPGRKAQTFLKAFPSRVWMQVDTHLWLSHDGEHLLLVPTKPLLMENLTRKR
jgi:hypothetical protein